MAWAVGGGGGGVIGKCMGLSCLGYCVFVRTTNFSRHRPIHSTGAIY